MTETIDCPLRGIWVNINECADSCPAPEQRVVCAMELKMAIKHERMPIGPYMNDDGDWWVPTDAATFQQARREVVSCLSYSIPDDGRLAYIGREKAWLGGEAWDDPDSHYVDAWHFAERRLW